MMKIGTLCSGIGAPEMALKLDGISHKIIFACDCDLKAKATYLLNHYCQIFCDDLYNINRMPNVDVLVAGFPCQPFSSAGKQNGLEDIRGKVILKILSLIKDSLPPIVILENVKGLTTMNGGKLLRFIVQQLEGMGYNVNHNILNALDFGVPQNRERIWIVATKQNIFSFPTDYCSNPGLKSIIDKGTSDSSLFVYPTPYATPKFNQIVQNWDHDYAPCITNTLSRAGSSSEYFSLAASFYYATGQARKPSITECLRLFGFPDTFKFPPSLTRNQCYGLLANSMAVPCLQNIFKNLVK